MNDTPGSAERETIADFFIRHPLWEDALALVLGTAMVALGVISQ